MSRIIYLKSIDFLMIGIGVKTKRVSLIGPPFLFYPQFILSIPVKTRFQNNNNNNNNNKSYLKKKKTKLMNYIMRQFQLFQVLTQ